MGACMSKEETNVINSSSSNQKKKKKKKKSGIASIPLKNSCPHELQHLDCSHSSAFIAPSPSPMQRSDTLSTPTVAAHARSILHSPLQRSPTIARGLPYFITTPLHSSSAYGHRSSHESTPQKRDLNPFLTRSMSFTQQPCLNTEEYPYPLQSKSTHSAFHCIYPHPFCQNMAIAKTFDESSSPSSSSRRKSVSFCDEATGKPRIARYPNSRQLRRMKRLWTSKESRSLSPSPRSLDTASSFSWHFNGSPQSDYKSASVRRRRTPRMMEGGSPARSKRDALVFLQRSSSNTFRNQDHVLMYPQTNISHQSTVFHQRGRFMNNKVSRNQEAQERRNVFSELPTNRYDPPAHATRSSNSKQKISENQGNLMYQIANKAYLNSDYSARSSLDSSACIDSGNDYIKDSNVWKKFDENCDKDALSEVAFQRPLSTTRARHSSKKQLHLPLHIQRAENNAIEFDKWERKVSMASSISKACSFWEAVVDYHLENLLGSNKIIGDHCSV